MEREREKEGESKKSGGRAGTSSCARALRSPQFWPGILALVLAPSALFAAQVLSIEGVGMATSNYAVQLSVGDTLDAGRTIRTNHFATCTLGWSGNTEKVSLEPDSNAELVGDNPIRFRLDSGTMRLSGKDVEVATAQATTTIRQAGSYLISLKDRKEIVDVLAGEAAVVVGANKEQYALRGGEELEIGANGAVKKGSVAPKGEGK
ncbi:hypothetical protein [Methylacidimicrobium tartarophylax]|uniref:FecR protein domain-containing protein n=1 Tax=Methylacidimicrobium tartarophylax TaxID=1041768 RepID=A0A5E6MAL5_9BACT|nr:hypothetical protein [Methylacidimicrobium tartarophylax]VVM06009.1 hypothetical protein MAMT_00908 [Methylacidimicrobium tartarophylax]